MLKELSDALAPHGIHLRGVVNFAAGEGPVLGNGASALSVVLLGNVGGSIWTSFAAWRESYGGAHPLDQWSKAIIHPVAERVGAEAFFPSDPPWQPFQQWAMKAEAMQASPLGILIHPVYGLWHGYRGALAFRHPLETVPEASPHPCASCSTKPCTTSCPVGAVRANGFDVARCRAYLRTEAARSTCLASGCVARNACPVGAGYRYPPAQLRFLMDGLGS